MLKSSHIHDNPVQTKIGSLTKHADYQLMPFGKGQREIAVALRLTEHKRMMLALTEVDVTIPRQVIHEQKARGEEPLSFTAFIAA